MAGFEAVEENLHATLAVFGRAKPAGQSCALAGVAVTSSGIQFSMFNSAVLTAPVPGARELERRVRTAREFFAARGLGWSFWVCQGWIEPGVRRIVGDVLYRSGLHEVTELPGMEASGLPPPARRLPQIECRRVSDAPTRADFSYIMSTAFGIPPWVAREVYQSENTWGGGMTGWVGYAGDLPVTTVATVLTGSVAGVYAVGTPPPHRRKGYAEAVMRHALLQARAESGVERSVLQSSEAGLLLYRSLGYRTVTRYAVFAT
jgi:GNAT superfamily N-acetyltransferase